MKRFVAVMNIPSPYRLHLLGELARQLKARGISFHCHFMAKGHADRPKSWLNPKIDFPHTYWRNFGFGQHEFNPGLILKMVFSRPDWMICGSSFDTFTGIGVMLLGRAKTKICWLEGNTKTPGKLDGFLGWFKRLIIGRCRYAAVPGSDAAKYIGLHQARTRRQMPTPAFLPNLVDEARFRPRNQWPVHDVAQRRESFGVDADGMLCIIPARLEPVKGLVPFLRALDSASLTGWKIVIMGQGPLKESIRQTICEQGLEDCVRVLDYVPYEEMPLCYAAADLLLLPSVYDPNPLSVIEALHSGLPVAVTDQAGNVEESVSPGGNGWVLPVLDQARYQCCLREVFSCSKATLRCMGGHSKSVEAEFWCTTRSVHRFLEEVLAGN